MLFILFAGRHVLYLQDDISVSTLHGCALYMVHSGAVQPHFSHADTQTNVHTREHTPTRICKY